MRVGQWPSPPSHRTNFGQSKVYLKGAPPVAPRVMSNPKESSTMTIGKSHHFLLSVNLFLGAARSTPRPHPSAGRAANHPRPASPAGIPCLLAQ